ncbi:hypothetical protein ACHAWX_001185 [Stephanocyclus meneghinianus]
MIGYIHEGMFCFSSGDQTKDALHSIRISSDSLRAAILDKLRNYKITPWHFHQKHLKRDANGKQKFKKLYGYKDEEGKL